MVALSPEALAAWQRGDISSAELVDGFADEILSYVKKLDPERDPGIYVRHVENELEQRRLAAAGPLDTIANLLAWAQRRVYLRHYEFRKEANPNEPPLIPSWLKAKADAAFVKARQRRIEPRWREVKRPQRAWREIKRHAASNMHELPSRLESELPEHDPPDLLVTMPDLARAVDKLPADERELVRILTLRVVGGWSLHEIARRNGSSLDHVAEEWTRARALIERDSNPRVGRIIRFEMLDVHVLQTLLQDQRLARAINWRTFEKLLAAIVEALGYEVELQQGTKDGGIDVVAIKRDSFFGPHRYLLQAKRWSNRVGVEPVRELLFLRDHYRATKACLATTSTFTQGAWQLASEYRWQLELRDYRRLAEWLELLKGENGRPTLV